eukprot:30927-Pelagococcus_subviridis.AAC.15
MKEGKQAGELDRPQPVPRDSVPLFRRRDDDVRAKKRAQVRGVIPGELDESLSEHGAQVFPPVLDALANKRFQRRDVHDLTSRLVSKRPHHRELGGYRLPRTRRRA